MEKVKQVRENNSESNNFQPANFRNKTQLGHFSGNWFDFHISDESRRYRHFPCLSDTHLPGPVLIGGGMMTIVFSVEVSLI